MNETRTRICRWVLDISLVLSLAACALLDGPGMTRLIPPAVGADPSVVRVVVVADATYPVNSATAEKTRMNWIDNTLAKNGYSKDYTVIQRDTVLRRNGLLGDIYDVYYAVRIKPEPPRAE